MENPNTDYLPFDNFVVRLPLLPFSQIFSVFNNVYVSSQCLGTLLNNPAIKEALFLASPELFNEIIKWQKSKEIKDESNTDKILLSILKYLLRMGSRCTPFGLFAGLGLGVFSDRNKIELAKESEYRAHLRLDMNYLCSLSQGMLDLPKIRKSLLFFPNTSLYKVGTNYRYVEYRYNNNRRDHIISSIESTDYLETIINRAGIGLDYNHLINLLVDHEITYEESKEYIDELISNQILISNIEPYTTGPDYLNHLVAHLKSSDNSASYQYDKLAQISNSIREINNSQIGIPLIMYGQIKENLNSLEINFNEKFLFQKDLSLSLSNNELDRKVVNDVVSCIELMNKITPYRSNDNLLQFVKKFYKRYEDREMPLAKVLDVEVGIGYGQASHNSDIATLVDDIYLPSKKNQSVFEWSEIDAILNNKYNEALDKGLYEVEIYDADFSKFKANWDNLPTSFSAMIEFHSVKDNDDFNFFIDTAGGSSALNLLARFGHTSDQLAEHITHIARKEQEVYNDKIIAEIVHLPQDRLGNVLQRPVFRDYEIPYLAYSIVPKKKQIDINDILISVKNGHEIILRSRKLNREIIPRLSTAHNYPINSLPIYHFLCDLQLQNTRGTVRFNWGPISAYNRFLPRVKYKRAILHKASWNFNKKDIDRLVNAQKKPNFLKDCIFWKEENNLPDTVVFVDGDNELLLFLNNVQCWAILINEIKMRRGFRLKEFLFDENNNLANRGKDCFTNQIIFSFYKSI